MRIRPALVTLAAVVLTAVGCGQAPEAAFVLHQKTSELSDASRGAVEKELLNKFGTPHQLVAWQKFPFDYGASGENLVTGRNLYMRHCLHCHGVSGDGNGPTARFLNPQPRDYRLGKFKFTSTKSGLKPRRDDLREIVKQGIPGTTMPSFVLLPESELNAIVEYVRWLSARGEYEQKLVATLVGEGGGEKDISRRVNKDGESREAILKGLADFIAKDFVEEAAIAAGDVADSWVAADADENLILPSIARAGLDAKTGLPTDESLHKGRELYVSKKAKCMDCHGPGGLGDGVLTEQFWKIPGTTPEQEYAEPGLHDDWGNVQKPRNLTKGQYRGGRRPVDLFRRVYAGIKGTQMPAFGGTALTDEEIWHLVNYVLMLPHQKTSPAAKHPEKPSVASTGG
ncbi:MAG: cytochrome c [Planctomycetales bacterium]|nr:cytochrome c [Planctomycetales bacterium]